MKVYDNDLKKSVDKWNDEGFTFWLLDGGGGFYNVVARRGKQTYTLEFDHKPTREEVYSDWINLISMIEINKRVE